MTFSLDVSATSIMSKYFANMYFDRKSLDFYKRTLRLDLITRTVTEKILRICP